MIWTITKRELLSNIIKFRFLISLILCLVLITASTFVLTMDYTIRLKEYKEESAARVEYLKTMKVHSQIKSGADKPPSPLGFLCVGSEREFGDTVQDVSYREVPREAIGQGGGNPLAVIFSSLDIAVFVQVILGLLAFLLAYDAISGERETGTLAVMLSNPVPRHHILLGKLLGGMISIAVPVIAGMLAGLIVALSFDSVSLNASAWARTGLVFLGSLLYLSALFMIGLFVSTRTRRSATSLVILLFIWVISVVLLPNMSPHAARHLRKVEDKATVDAKREALEAEFWRKVDNFRDAQKRAGKWQYPLFFRFMDRRSPFSGDSPYPAVVFYAPKENMIWYMEGLEYCVPLRMEYAGKIWELYRSYETELQRQVALSDNMSRISPSWVYYNVISILAGTDSNAYKRFMEQARQYRNQLIDYTATQRGFSTMSFFTTMKMGETLTYQQLMQIESDQGSGAISKIKASYWDKAPTLKDIPVFYYRWESPAESVRRAAPDLLIIFLLNIVFFLALYASFVRQEVK
jgi:ABC-type transport system involved in multi-copper enzyme maturation permease subunit